MNAQTIQPTLKTDNAQTTQHTLKAAISNALELRSMTTKQTNNSNHNFQLESYSCNGSCSACG
ncbi:hypothetical protein [Nostoc sp.]|uniref:hypothetical protein n=1 Tax=Nostoc sp. TaxID=1180 RepID=UPI002FFA5C6E